MISSQKKIGKSEIEINIELSGEELEAYREKAVASLRKNAKAEGFRPGHVPGNIVEKQVGEGVVLEEMAHFAVSENYAHFVQEKELDVIGEPDVQILKLAPGNPFEFCVKVAVLPEVELPDYKQLAGETARKRTLVEEREVQETLQWLQKSRTEQGNEVTSDVPVDETGLSDEFTKSLGNFEGLGALKESIREGLGQEKEMQETDRLRQEILEKIAEKAKVEVPNLLIEREKAVLLDNVKKGVTSMMQIDFKDYLEKSGKTEQETLDSFSEEAEQRVKKFLVLREVAKKESIAVTKEEVEEETNRILEHYKDIKTAKKEIDPERLKEYTEGVIRHEKTLQLLQQFAKDVPVIEV